MKSAGLLIIVFSVIASVCSAQNVVRCLGRVEPSAGVYPVAARSGYVLGTAHVQPGDTLAKGQAIASLLPAAPAVHEAQRSRLALLLAEVEVLNARSDNMMQQNIDSLTKHIETQRGVYAHLKKQSQIQKLTRDEVAGTLRENDLIRAGLTLEKSQMELVGLQLERQKMQDSGAIRLEQARQALQAFDDATVIRSPIAGVLLTLRPRNPIAAVADTSDMRVIAEVYEADARRIRAGQRVTLSSSALPKPLQGKVQSVNRMVHQSTINSLDPVASSASRVVEAIISLENSGPVRDLTYLQVGCTIHLK